MWFWGDKWAGSFVAGAAVLYFSPEERFGLPQSPSSQERRNNLRREGATHQKTQKKTLQDALVRAGALSHLCCRQAHR